jgi:gamma-glutamyltranspeptidase / glutathione hydrolase
MRARRTALARILAVAVLMLVGPGAGSARAAAGVVSAASPEAAAAGREVLERGGNAIDAAVAIAFSLGVTEPAMSGLGAGIQILLQAPGREPLVINGTSLAPAKIPAGATARDLTAHRATTVPSSVRTLDHAWRHHGSGRLSWADLLAPAIRSAEEGFVIGPFRHKVLQRTAASLRTHPSGAALMLNPDGSVPAAGTLWRQPVLARTLRRLAAHGAADFYHGEIAREIAADMAVHGGWITAEDLANLPEPREQPALRGTYRGWEVATLAPPASGWVVLQILNVLEQSAPAELAPGSPTRDERLVEALAIGHTSNQRNPIHDPADPVAESAGRISKETAVELLTAARARNPGETTHFSVVDRDGLAVAVTTSINNYYGAQVASPSLGFLYNDYMHEFVLDDPAHPFALRGGARPFSSMSALILSRDGIPRLAVGSPGSARIISAVSQVVQLWADGQSDIAGAVATPRWHLIPPDRIYSEGQPAGWRERFAPRGWRFPDVPTDLALNGLNAYFGGVHAIAWELDRWTGAADPRRDGAVEQARGP